MNQSANAFRYSLANAFDLAGFVITRPVERVIDICQAVRSSRTIGTLVGLPGVGKSWAAQHVAQTEPEPSLASGSPILYTAVDVKGSRRDLLVNILNCLGPDYRAPLADMTRLVCSWIHRRMTELIIIDEADRLDKGCLELLRDIHDRTHCAILLVGQPALARRLYRYEALHNRIGLAHEMVALTYDELYALLQQQSQMKTLNRRLSISLHDEWDDVEIVKEIYRVTLGNLRRVTQFTQQVERVAAVNGHWYVQLETAQAVAAMIEGQRC